MYQKISQQDISEILSQWLLPRDSIIQSTNQGTSHSVYVIKAKDNHFILKLYGDSITTKQIEYEHSLLAYLEKANLSFNIPTPLPNHSGKTIVHTRKNNILLRATLMPFISGKKADRQNYHHAYAAGRALGELHYALADFDPEGLLAQLPQWGDLYQIHPLTPDPFAISKILELTPVQESRLVKTFSDVLEAQSKLHQALPIQTIHADYLSFNILVENNQVVGILDFEFSTRDLRLVDYICGLEDYAMLPWKKNSRWKFIEAFCTGYAEYVLLTSEELEAIPIAWRLQRASCIIYWTGWLQEGKLTDQKVLEAINETFIFEDWLEQNTIKLLQYIQSG